MLEQEDLQQEVLVVKRKISMVHFLRVVNLKIEVVPEAQVSMAVLVVLNIPLLYFLNKDWYAALMTTVPGKAVLAVCAAAIFLSFARVVKLTQPIEYRR